MELNWTTFLLEIINFLVLVWILKRFLFKPMQDVIARRRALIEKDMADAAAASAEAESVKLRYENRLDDWEKERARSMEKLQEEMEQERTRRRAALAEEMKQEQSKARALEERRLLQLREQSEASALRNATHFLASMLKRLADAQLEARIIDMVMEDLGSMPDERMTLLREACRGNSGSVLVQTTHPLDTRQRQALQKLFERISDSAPLQWKYSLEPALLAGIHIAIGAWSLDANLRDELDFFAQAAQRDA